MRNLTLRLFKLIKKVFMNKNPSDFTMTVRCERFGTKKIPNGGLRYLILTGY